jgi:hypothetical protein
MKRREKICFGRREEKRIFFEGKREKRLLSEVDASDRTGNALVLISAVLRGGAWN